MKSDQHDRLAAEHVLGLLEGEEHALAERLLLTEASFGAAVDHWRAQFAEFDDTTPVASAGENLWQRIEAGIGTQTRTEAQTHAQAERRPPAVAAPKAGGLMDVWNSLTFWRATGMTAAFASLLLAMGMGFFAAKAVRQPVMIAVLVNDANEPGAVLSAFADGRAEFVPLGATTVPHNHSMQLWTFPDPTGAPVSVGVMDAARTVRLNLERLPRLNPEQLFAISMEPLHGSPTGLPTGPVILKGTVATAL